MCLPLIPMALSGLFSTVGAVASGVGAAASGIWGALTGAGAAGAAGAATTGAATTGAAATGAAAAGGGLSLSSVLSSPWLLGASAVMSGASSYMESNAANKANQYNAALSEAQAKDAEIRGRQNEEKVRRATAQLMGDQRVNMASSGVELSSGTPVDLVSESAFYGEQDALTARFNASREAAAKRSESTMYQNMRRNSALAAGTSVLGSLSPLALKYSGTPRTATVGIG